MGREPRPVIPLSSPYLVTELGHIFYKLFPAQFPNRRDQLQHSTWIGESWEEYYLLSTPGINQYLLITPGKTY